MENETEKGSRMTPSEALFHTMSSHWMLDSKRRWPKPGQLVELMRPEVREALSRLTSEEASEMSLDFLGGVETVDQRRMREQQEKDQYDRLFSTQMEQRSREIRLRLMFEAKLKLERLS